MDAFSTIKRGYRFKERIDAYLFLSDLSKSGLSLSTIKLVKGLPQYKGQVNTGWTVWTRTRSICDELAVHQRYKAIFDSVKMEEI